MHGAAAASSQSAQSVQVVVVVLSGRLELGDQQLPPEAVHLPLVLGDLQPQHRVAIIHQLADLCHRGVRQDLDHRGQLGVERVVAVGRHEWIASIVAVLEQMGLFCGCCSTV